MFVSDSKYLHLNINMLLNFLLMSSRFEYLLLINFEYLMMSDFYFSIFRSDKDHWASINKSSIFKNLIPILLNIIISQLLIVKLISQIHFPMQAIRCGIAFYKTLYETLTWYNVDWEMVLKLLKEHSSISNPSASSWMCPITVVSSNAWPWVMLTWLLNFFV